MRAPTLAEVLTNQAPPPYSLSAFMAFLSQNHCLETLEFTLDASRYQTHYYSLSQLPPKPGSEEAEGLRVSWQRLISSYIKPGAQREVNLPSFDRDFLLRIPNTYTPPSPEALDGAVYKITELMRESVLSPFLLSCQQSMCQDQQEHQQFMFTNQMNLANIQQNYNNGQSQMYSTHQQGNTFDMYASTNNNNNNNYTHVPRHLYNTSGSGIPQQHFQQSNASFGQPNQLSGQQHQSSQQQEHFQQQQQSGISQLISSSGRRISRPGSARPTSVPSAEFLQSVDSWSNGGDLDSEMSGSEDPITPPHTPPAGTSPSNGSHQWRSKIKNQFSRMNGNRSKSREPQ